MRLLYATTNKGKLVSMKRALSHLNIEIYGLDNVDCHLPSILEDGNTPLENAIIKAEAYYKALKVPLFSCDSGLYFDGIDEKLQPGLFIRRVNGRELSDDEMISYYSKLAEKHGGKIIGRYKNAICLITEDEKRYTCFDKTLWTEPFILTSTPHTKRAAGFPLDSLSIDIASGNYYYELESRSVDQEAVRNGYSDFLSQYLTE